MRLTSQFVIPAKAGIQTLFAFVGMNLDSRLRGNDNRQHKSASLLYHCQNIVLSYD